jgi:hypothetical protein
MSNRTSIGVGISLGAIMAVPATAQADDLKVTNLNDEGPGSFRQAIEDANNDTDPDRILFKSKLSGTIELFPTGPLAIYGGDLTIKGPGARKLTVDAGGDSRVLAVYSVVKGTPPLDVTISGLTITGGSGEGYQSGLGGGILNYGADSELTLKQVTVTGNEAIEAGGGIASIEGAELAVNSSTVSGNTVDSGVAFDRGYGGGIYGLDSEVTITNSTISGNDSNQDGGGVYFTGATSAALRQVTITDNEAADDGGGLYARGDDLDVLGTIVADNSAPGEDDDLYVHTDFSFSFSLIGDPDDTGLTSDDGNIIGPDPNLKPLMNNGGPTNTHAFKKSPAKNKVPKSESEKKDQRGAKRKGKGDIGAYELVKCEGVIVNRVGTGKKDKLKGTKRKDGILGLGGNDKLSGKKGKDGLCGGRGKDKLKGGPGKDKLDGGPGKDKEIQ